MYTSGSTGTPKGIEICHRAILRLVVGVDYVEFAPGRAVLHAAPLAFDASTLEIWGPLLNGGCCVIHDERVPTGAGLARTIARHDVHTAWLTAALFNAVVDDDPAHLAGLRTCSPAARRCRCRMCAARSRAAGPRAQQRLRPDRVHHLRGHAPHRASRALPDDLRSVPLGRPIKDTVLRVLSPSMALLPSGFVGELCIGGHGLARGYLRQPELSAERFVPDPFGGPGRPALPHRRPRALAARRHARIHRPRDGQVKIHGHRIETGEVEAAILAHPAVQSCAVVARPDASGQLRLVAYLVARTQPVPWDALRAHLAARLPAALVPSAQVWLAQLPVTPNGKLDRKALPEPAGERPELAQPFEEAHDALEQQVCEAFARALRIDKVGRNDNFFDLGGDSLLVLQVLAELQRGTGLRCRPIFFSAIPRQKQWQRGCSRRAICPPRPLRPVASTTAQRPLLRQGPASMTMPSPSSAPPAAFPAPPTSSSSGQPGRRARHHQLLRRRHARRGRQPGAAQRPGLRARTRRDRRHRETSTPPSSASARRRRSSWTRSSACSWKSAGSAWSARATCPTPRRARWACTPACTTPPTSSAT
jgi:hypothetical protein